MKREKSLPYDAQPIVFSRWIRIIFLLIFLGGVIYWFFNYVFKCIDGCGPYHNSTSVADLDGDGDLDVVLNNLRHETETIIWAGATLWINQDGGEFTPRRVDLGGPSTVAGDLDGDGDADLAQMTYTAKLHLNQGGEQGGVPGEFKQGHSIALLEDAHNWSSNGSVVLGDLNNDGLLDALIAYCCSTVVDKREGLLPFLPWVWINLPNEIGVLIGDGMNLYSLGDLPMRPTLGDLDGDGDLDIYAASLPPKKGNGYDSADRILLNDGSGNFVDSGQRLDNPSKTGAAGRAGVALGDLDGDGDLDALVGKAAGAIIWINQGGVQSGQAGAFVHSSQRLGRDSIEAAFLADLDADGDLDAILAGVKQASIWWNDGQGVFSNSGQRLRYDERHGLAVGDFDGDDNLDVFSAAYDIGFHIWLNQGDGRLQEGN